MSRVKNVIVSDTETFQEELIQELIKNQISYVQIKNEFHFLDYIYRIYDLELVAKLVINYKAFNELNDFYVNLDEKINSTILNTSIEYVSHIDFDQNKVDFCKEKFIPRINKQLIKQQNRQVNKTLNRKYN